MPQDGGLREEKGKRESQSEGEPEKSHEETEGAAITSFCRVAGTLGAETDGFQHEPQDIGGPENNRVGGASGEWQRVQERAYCF